MTFFSEQCVICHECQNIFEAAAFIRRKKGISEGCEHRPKACHLRRKETFSQTCRANGIIPLKHSLRIEGEKTKLLSSTHVHFQLQSERLLHATKKSDFSCDLKVNIHKICRLCVDTALKSRLKGSDSGDF